MEQERITKQCPYCGEEISINAIKCKHCGEWLEDSAHRPVPQQQSVVTQTEYSNAVGTAGFVIALICTCLSWLPVANVLFWFTGLVLSFIGMFKRPRGLAIAGFVISIIDIIIIVAIVGTIGGVIGGLLNGLLNV